MAVKCDRIPQTAGQNPALGTAASRGRCVLNSRRLKRPERRLAGQVLFLDFLRGEAAINKCLHLPKLPRDFRYCDGSPQSTLPAFNKGKSLVQCPQQAEQRHFSRPSSNPSLLTGSPQLGGWGGGEGCGGAPQEVTPGIRQDCHHPLPQARTSGRW